MPVDLIGLASQAPNVILLVLGLYLFKVVVNDLRHDLRATQEAVERSCELLQQINDKLDAPRGPLVPRVQRGQRDGR